MNFQQNVPFAPYTTFKIGGPAKFFCEAKNEEDIRDAFKFAREKKLPVFALGGGSNILVSDKGFGGLVIKLLNSDYSVQDNKIECGAGCLLAKIVSESVKAELSGLEWAAGIPGTVGGAVRGNAGAFGGKMADIVKSVKILDIHKSQISILSNEDCKFAYRDSQFKQDPNLIILSVVLELKKGEKSESEKMIKEVLEKRKEKQPSDFPSPGSFFKNPVAKSKKLIQQFETDTGQKVKDDKIPAPWLIEECGLKGKKIGGAMVSEKHANFLVNTGNATAEDVVMLAAIIKTKVRNKFGIQLKEEVQMVGF